MRWVIPCRNAPNPFFGYNRGAMSAFGGKPKDRLRVLVLEPYYGGSHRAFLEGLAAHLPFAFELLALPARKWKWRMRLAAPHFARLLRERKERFDRILCSPYLDAAAFKGLAPARLQGVPLLTYFHENQFAYPVQVRDERDMHFALTNVTTALASDGIAFNSRHNKESFLRGARGLLRRAGDMRLEDPLGEIRAKAGVLPPGVDYTDIDREKPPDAPKAPATVLWNHRWEHDKDPELFFRTLLELAQEGVDFGVVVVGESFQRRPEIFREARERLGRRILRMGYVKSTRQYARWLRRGQVAVSTARHEFFGMAVLEAVRAGCRPLLPRRLSYPEIFPGKYLYGEGEFKDRLKEALAGAERLDPAEAARLTEPYRWETLVPLYEEWLRSGKLP
jgi:glycosyltransferase involved in cell wall biosynthesis